MKINEDVWKFVQEHLRYTDDEMKKFRQNPRNADVISKTPALMNKTIVVEVIDSHGCNSQHKVGDKFYFDGVGNLLTKFCPKRICFGILHSMPILISIVFELFYAGVDPNEMRFKRIGCGDVGLECGGWGRVVVEIKIEDRKNLGK